MSKNTWLSTTGIAVAVAASVVAASCGASPSGTLSMKASTVSSTTPPTGTPPAGTNGQAAAASCADAPASGDVACGDLSLHRVRVVVRRTVLEKADAPKGATGPTGPTGPTGHPGDDWQEEGDCEHDSACRHEEKVEVGPYLIDICGAALVDTTFEVKQLDVPVGDYEEIKFVVNTLRKAKDLPPELQAMKDAHASILVEGTYKGAPFTFKTPMRVAQEREGTFTIGEGANPVTVNLAPATWFAGPGGAVLDPSDPTNRGAILANIRCALRVHPGDDDDDDEEHEKKSCASPSSAEAMSHDADKGMCGVEDEHKDWEGCHHCCSGTALVCKPGTGTGTGS